MIEIQEYPKAIYHPDSDAMVIVQDADQEQQQLDAWGVDAPKIPLISDTTDDGAQKAKATGNRRAPKAKAAN